MNFSESHRFVFLALGGAVAGFLYSRAYNRLIVMHNDLGAQKAERIEQYQKVVEKYAEANNNVEETH